MLTLDNPDSAIIAALCGDPGHDHHLRHALIVDMARHPLKLDQFIAMRVSRGLSGDYEQARIAGRLLMALPHVRADIEDRRAGKIPDIPPTTYRTRERFDD